MVTVEHGFLARFAANAVVHYGGRIVSCVWDFGDGQTVVGEDVEHTYATVGMYRPAVTMTDSFGHVYSYDVPNVSVTVGLELFLTEGQTYKDVVAVQGRVVGTAEIVSLAILADGIKMAEVTGNAEIVWNWDTLLSANGVHSVTLRSELTGGYELVKTVPVMVTNPCYRILLMKL
ncbi:MAG: PKD domain-containing protein [Firmicutes bacterium]|nr:PKD domain-containing protein [Bacillota bacterium]